MRIEIDIVVFSEFGRLFGGFFYRIWKIFVILDGNFCLERDGYECW